MNVATKRGKQFVIGYSLLCMWIFGWFASQLSEVIQGWNSKAAISFYKRWRQFWHRLRQGTYMRSVEEQAAWDAKMKEAFEKMDASGDGEIDTSELIGLAASLGVELEEDDLQGVLKTIDLDGSNTINLTEFRKMMTHLDPPRAKQKNGQVSDLSTAFISTIRNLIRIEAPMILASVGVFIVVNSGLFYGIENTEEGAQWEFFDTLWFLTISTTTIGLGDMSLNWNRPGAAYVQVCMIAIGIVAVAEAIGVLAEFFDNEIELMEQRIATKTKKIKKITKRKSSLVIVAPAPNQAPAAHISDKTVA